jgi:hypothetical protein
MAITTTTKLQAVNTMLQTIGESSVTSITSGTLPYEVAAAVTMLEEVVREVCMDSYVFNTEEDRVLTADGGTGKISAITPQHYVQIRNQGSGEDYVIRSGFVYSMLNKTNVFALGSTITITGVYLLDFLDLPEAAKRFCVIRAARTYADRMVGSKDIRAFSERDELEAKAKLNDYEFGIDRINMLGDSSTVAFSLVRRS